MHLILSYFENMNVNVEVKKMVVVEFANRVVLDEADHLDLHCLPSRL